MDQIKEFLTRRNIITLLVIAVLAVGLVVGVRLVQEQTQLKSKAATALEGAIWDIKPNPVNKVGGNWQQMTISVGANDQNWQLLFYNPGTCSLDSCPLVGWYVVGTGNDDKVITWNPPPQVTGPHSFALFDGAVSIIDVKDVNFIEPAQPTPTPTPPPTITVAVSGKVTSSTNTSKVVGGVTVQLFTSNGSVTSNGPTRVTNSNGDYSISTTGGIVSYAVRIISVPSGYNSNASAFNTSEGTPSYENQPAAGGCKTSCDFTLTPLAVGAEAAICGPVTTGGQDIKLQVLTPGTAYPVYITMTNPSVADDGAVTKDWPTTYSLRWIGTNEDKNVLNFTTTRLNVGKTVQSGDSYTFPTAINITPSKAGTYTFNWSMFNDSNTKFGGACETPIVVGGQGGPPPPGDGINFTLDVGDDREITQGSELSQFIEAERIDVNPTDIRVSFDVTSGFPTGVTHSFSSGSCILYKKTATTSSSCDVRLKMNADENAQTISSTINIKAKDNTGGLERTSSFELKVKPKITLFNFTVSTPADITLTKGQTDPGRDITITKTAGDAENVTLSVSGDLGGAQYSFKPSATCKPEDGTCKRKLIFDTSNATPGDYYLEIQGNATGGRSKVSDSFKLTVKPEATVVTCFVVSTLPGTRSLFNDCDSVKIENMNNPAGGVIAGFLDSSSQTFGFTLSPGNDSKILYARFLKLPQGESIKGGCAANSTKCKETTAGITLNVAAPSPPPTAPPSPPPVTGCACQADNTCSSPPCQFTRLTGVDYGLPPGSGPIQCSLPAAIHNIVPSGQDKNSWCNRQSRTLGDADGNGVKDENDYLYWLTAVNLGKVPVSVNPDFDGDGQIDADDLTIWSR